MNLRDLGQSSPKKINQILESRFGFRIDFSNLTIQRADGLLASINEGLRRVRISEGAHTSQRSPKYTEMLLVKEGLEKWLESQYITEGEVESAQTILAAKDFVDRLQSMIEDAGQMLNEDLPPLGDSIRDQLGIEQGDRFVGAVTGALNSLLEATKAAREQVDSATRVLAGEETPSADLDSAELVSDMDSDTGDMDDMGSDMEPSAGGDMDQLPELPDLKKEKSPEPSLGRARR
jgi:hypothetical protein